MPKIDWGMVALKIGVAGFGTLAGCYLASYAIRMTIGLVFALGLT